MGRDGGKRRVGGCYASDCLTGTLEFKGVGWGGEGVL